MRKRLLVKNHQAPGDIIVLSAALRDLEIAHPGKYSIELCVSAGAEEVYWHNPNIAQIFPAKARIDMRGGVTWKAQYPLIKRCNQERKHFMLGFIEHLNAQVGTKVKLTDFRPHIVMSETEKQTRPFEEPYWIFLSGGKKDFPTKIWAQSYWQQLIDMTKDRVNWVQCGGGSSNHIMHTPKRGIFANMIAKTGCRNFLRLIYHAEGVVCVTTMAMHAAAAFNKPCIVIEGGREPWWWEAYNYETREMNMKLFDPGWSPPADDDFVPHTYLHTIGQLKCCSHHGCWKKRVTGGGSVCSKPVSIDGQMVPKCKSMISPEMVAEAIDSYFERGMARRATTSEIILPKTSMCVPTEQREPETTPAPVKRQPVPKGPKPDPDNVEFCLYGLGVPIGMAGTNVTRKLGVSRTKAIQSFSDSKHEWIVWIEDGAKLCDNWLERITAKMTSPAVVGRIHRTRDGELYPCPTFFAVHRTLIKEADDFTQSFDVTAKQVRDVRDIVKLSTVPVDLIGPPDA